MVVFLHEPNSVGRAKLRRLTIKRQMTLQDIADAIGYSRPAVSYAASGRSAGTKLIRRLEAFSDGAITEKDWQRKYRGDAGNISLFESYGRPPGPQVPGQPADGPFQEAPSRAPTTTERHLKIAKLRERARRLPR